MTKAHFKIVAEALHDGFETLNKEGKPLREYQQIEIVTQMMGKLILTNDNFSVSKFAEAALNAKEIK
jgi:hypothetical protein